MAEVPLSHKLEAAAEEPASGPPFGQAAGSFQSRVGTRAAARTTAAERRQEAAAGSPGRWSPQGSTPGRRAGGTRGDALPSSRPAAPGPAACEPQTHVVFLKTHKTASSTIMNLLFRFGETHNLTFALPARGASQLGYPHYFRAEFVEGFGAPGHAPHFNIMCHHLRFLRDQVQRVMPNSTFYFSILRNPVHLMESSFSYYKGTSPFARARSLEEFLSQPERFYRPLEPDSHYAKNLMAFDFGFNHNGAVSAQHSQQMLRHLEQVFDLLLLSEYFDESMVLLKEALCWDLDSVVAFPLNSREGGTRSPLSQSTAEKIKSWNSLDWWSRIALRAPDKGKDAVSAVSPVREITSPLVAPTVTVFAPQTGSSRTQQQQA
nr:galactose-3-O-sulfotransferase 2-like [Pelodiscus sinensis]|eukprot:XP_025041318.1 galactose-3-O-sulfotransferase 2-like [Pelodiscus sinensis]